MIKSISALFCGLLFGIALIISGMSNPAKVIGFLDILNNWDPTLILVMVGAIGVAGLGFFILRQRSSGLSLLGEDIHWPTKVQIDAPLIVGSLLFGIGWGMAGICPGPGLVMLGTGIWQGFVFVGLMLVGMVIYEIQVRYQAYVKNTRITYGEQNG